MAPLASHAMLQVVHTCWIPQICVNKARGSKVSFFVCISVVLKKFQSKLFCVVSWGAYHLHRKPGNKMVRIIPFGVLLKLWASGQSDAFLLLLLGFTAHAPTFCMFSTFC